MTSVFAVVDFFERTYRLEMHLSLKKTAVRFLLHHRHYGQKIVLHSTQNMFCSYHKRSTSDYTLTYSSHVLTVPSDKAQSTIFQQLNRSRIKHTDAHTRARAEEGARIHTHTHTHSLSLSLSLSPPPPSSSSLPLPHAIHTHTHVRTHTHTHTHTNYARTHAHTHTHTHTHARACVCTCL